MKRIPPAIALKHVYHSVYLQLLMGAVLSVLLPAMTHRTDLFGADMRPLGGMLFFSAINIYCYLQRYKRALAANAPAASEPA